MNLNEKSNKKSNKKSKKINKKSKISNKKLHKKSSTQTYGTLNIKKRLNNVHPLKMFSKKDLIDQYKKSQEHYSKCMIKEFEYSKSYQEEYQNIYSNKQIKTLWKLSKNNRNIGHRLLSMITKRMDNRSYGNIINMLNKLDKDDDIYNKLHEIYLVDDKNKVKKDICPLVDFKSTLYYDKIMNFIVINQKEKNIIIDSYLDIGCGNCKVTEKLGKLFGLNSENIYGADFSEFDEQKYTKEKNINFTLLEKNYTKLPYDTNSMSLISLINVIHHVSNLNVLFKELKRILKPNGILMIIEPDVLDYIDYMFIDIEHLLYHFVYNKNRSDNLKIKDLKDIESNYFNWISLDLILKEYGFKYKYSHYLSRKFKYDISYNREFFTFYMVNNTSDKSSKYFNYI